ncbi:MAG: hypothetical protein E6J26_08430 [Chloroflexi bacterium]|nr:MAG: hypothetical protein E6J26_08430 [Chloroflexota bacterium]
MDCDRLRLRDTFAGERRIAGGQRAMAVAHEIECGHAMVKYEDDSTRWHQPYHMTSITTTWLDYREVYPTHHVSGNLKVLHQLWSPQLRNARDILLWLPPSYQHSRRHYPVIYMQDAQNLFDPATSFGGQTWHVGETMTALGREGIEAIVVGIPHMGEQRIVEYNPFPSRHPGRGEQYVEFLLETLKPLVDRDFRTLPMPST